MARDVNNWGRWGADDQLGTLNHITPAQVRRAGGLVVSGRTISLSAPLNSDGPQAGNGLRRNPIHVMTLDGGDELLDRNIGTWGGTKETTIVERYDAGPMRYNDDLLILPPQAATQWDALSHVYYDGKLYNGFDARSVSSLGASRDAIDSVAAAGQIVARGVLLDIARHRGLPHLAPNTVVSADDLNAVVQAQGVELEQGDVIIVRTGWWHAFRDGMPGPDWFAGTPGLSWRCAGWLHRHQAAAVAADNMTVEVMPAEDGVFLLFHMLALRDMGMMLGEMWDLEALSEDCAEDGRYDFLLSAAPLNITGGVGSPVNPVAVK
jgi:kynurenine formamidase